MNTRKFAFFLSITISLVLFIIAIRFSLEANLVFNNVQNYIVSNGGNVPTCENTFFDFDACENGRASFFRLFAFTFNLVSVAMAFAMGGFLMFAYALIRAFVNIVNSAYINFQISLRKKSLGVK